MAESQIPNKKPKGPSTQQFVPIKEIKDGVVVMKDGSLRSVVLVSSINFALKNDEEKDAIIFSYQSFLNSLNYPVQIMIKSRRLYLDNYLQSLAKIVENQTNELLRLQTAEYISYIEELLEYSNIMEKRFFVVVPYYPSGVEKVGLLKKLIPSTPTDNGDFDSSKMELNQRVDNIISGLSSVGLRCVSLDTEELIELYYTFYNPDTSGNEKIQDTNNLESSIITKGDNLSSGGGNVFI